LRSTAFSAGACVSQCAEATINSLGPSQLGAQATQEIARILSKNPGFAEAIFQSAEWTGPQAPPRWKQAALTFYNPRSIRRLREAQEKTDAQAWILHNYIPVVSGGVFREARRQQVPIIQYIHNFRPFSVSSYLWAGRRLDPAHWPANYVREICYGAWQDSRSKTAFLASFLALLHLTRQFRAIKAWVAVSKFMREKFIAAGVAPERIAALVCPIGIDGVRSKAPGVMTSK